MRHLIVQGSIILNWNEDVHFIQQKQKQRISKSNKQVSTAQGPAQ
jgi:hypothetical protein